MQINTCIYFGSHLLLTYSSFGEKTVTYFITVRYFLKLVMPGLCLNFFFVVNTFLSCLLCTETMQTKQNLYRIQRLSLSGD